MSKRCTHLNSIRDVTPSALGCEECLKTGDAWFHLRICRTCGHVGCCDQSPGKHATKHYHATRGDARQIDAEVLQAEPGEDDGRQRGS